MIKSKTNYKKQLRNLSQRLRTQKIKQIASKMGLLTDLQIDRVEGVINTYLHEYKQPEIWLTRE